MSRYAVTIFGQQKNYGWTEVYPINAASPSAASTVLLALLPIRQLLMCSDASLIGARISDTDVKNDSWPTGATFPLVGAYVGVAGTVTYNPQIAMRLLAFGGGLIRGSRWLRAIPDDEFTAAGAFLGVAGWLANLTSYINFLIANVSVATKIRGAIVPPFYTFTPITAVSQKGTEKRNIGRPFGLPRGRRLIA